MPAPDPSPTPEAPKPPRPCPRCGRPLAAVAGYFADHYPDNPRYADAAVLKCADCGIAGVDVPGVAVEWRAGAGAELQRRLVADAYEAVRHRAFLESDVFGPEWTIR